jgi:hypothetical protein
MNQCCDESNTLKPNAARKIREIKIPPINNTTVIHRPFIPSQFAYDSTPGAAKKQILISTNEKKNLPNIKGLLGETLLAPVGQNNNPMKISKIMLNGMRSFSHLINIFLILLQKIVFESEDFSFIFI